MRPRFFDCCANLGDAAFGADLELVVNRAFDQGNLKGILNCVGCLQDLEAAAPLALQDPRLKFSVGIHPTRSNQIHQLEALIRLAREHSENIQCVGEIGLDYARLQFSGVADQRAAFAQQLRDLREFDRPYLFHLRDAEEDHDPKATQDFFEILDAFHADGYPKKPGVVHSFSGSLESLKEVLKRDYYVGLNFCSLKSEENLRVVKEIPLDRLLLETDAPYCGPKKSHASWPYYVQSPHWVDHQPPMKKKQWQPGQMLKDRQEPLHVGAVAATLFEILEPPLSYGDFCEQVYQNSVKLLGGSL